MKTKLCLMLASAALVALPPAVVTAQDISPAAGSTLTPDQARPEGFIMIDGRVHIVRRGVATPLQQDMFLRVTPTGVIGFDAVPRIINNNSMMMLDGSIVAAPPDVILPPPSVLEAAELPDPRLAPRSVLYGVNSTGLMPNPGLTQPQSRFVSAKKSSSAKSKSKATAKAKSVAKKPAKKAAAKAAPPAVPRFPAFDDDTLELPDVQLSSNGPVAPVIDATSTMLYMTNSPGQPLTPEDVSIGASLGTQASGSEARLNSQLSPQSDLPEQPAEPAPAPAPEKEETPDE